MTNCPLIGTVNHYIHTYRFCKDGNEINLTKIFLKFFMILGAFHFQMSGI